MPNLGCVLIVDDNPEDIQLISNILQGQGYGVRSASDTRSGLELAAKERFDVVLLDNRFVNSPTVGISSVADFAAKAAWGVVMMTAFANEDLEKDAQLLGASGFLTKPIDSAALLCALAQIAPKGKPAST
jgi:CheY-like chemotaxis protein